MLTGVRQDGTGSTVVRPVNATTTPSATTSWDSVPVNQDMSEIGIYQVLLAFLTF